MDPAPLDVESLARSWAISVVPRNGVADVPVADDDLMGTGVVDTTHWVGEVSVYPPGQTHDATAEVYSNDDGGTYWVSAEAPGWFYSPNSIMGSAAELDQEQSFRKVTDDASLQYVITEILLEAIDDNGQSPQHDGCRWFTGARPIPSECEKLLRANVSFEIEAIQVPEDEMGELGEGTVLFHSGGAATLYGFGGVWYGRALTDNLATDPLWSVTDFESYVSADESDASLRLKAPIVIEIPIDTVPVGGVVVVTASVKARAYSRRGNEAYISAYFRDLVKTSGASLTYEGLDPIDLDVTRPVPLIPEPPCVGASTPSMGTLQFDSTTYYEPEQPGGMAWIVVLRTGGSEGMAAARFVTTDGDAVAKNDYESVDTYVVFADGEVGARLVQIPIVADTVAEPNEIVNLSLSDVPGCGSIGAPSTATLTIEDDDRPPAEIPTYTIGGTVTGLTGTGLVLTNLSTDPIMPVNGPFTFPREFPSGIIYHVRVATQPVNPVQVCTLANGEGTIDDHDVTDVAVECVTPPPDDGLDPGFGEDGIVTMGVAGGAQAMALQTDQKIVGLGQRVLARYNADGTRDQTFGIGGEVAIQLPGSVDMMQGVAIQADGRIVAVGYTRIGGTRDDFAVARFNSDGSPDGTFGTGGIVTTDIGGLGSRAWDVAIQPDGAIVVGGHGASAGPLGPQNDFAIARYTAAGVPDSTFGGDGVAVTDIGGRTDLGYAVTLQADGKIVLAGRVADSGGDAPDFGFVRYDMDGNLDATFGVSGVSRLVTDDIWDEAADVVVQPDGRIVAAGFSNPQFMQQKARFAILRLEPDGAPDATFGSAGFVEMFFSDAADYSQALALQSDGKIIVVGQMSNESNPDFAIARFLSDGTPDSDFGVDGQVFVDFFGASDVAKDVVLQSDGKIVVGGVAVNGTAVGLGLVRVVP
jgi:uncharacterized delta-60 repeat protein